MPINVQCTVSTVHVQYILTDLFSLSYCISLEIERCLREQTHGGCNVLHLLGTLAPPCPPSPGAPVPQSGSGRGRSSFPSLREIMHQSMHLPATSVVGELMYMYYTLYMYMCTMTRHRYMYSTCSCTMYI